MSASSLPRDPMKTVSCRCYCTDRARDTRQVQPSPSIHCSAISGRRFSCRTRKSFRYTPSLWLTVVLLISAKLYRAPVTSLYAFVQNALPRRGNSDLQKLRVAPSITCRDVLRPVLTHPTETLPKVFREVARVSSCVFKTTTSLFHEILTPNQPKIHPLTFQNLEKLFK